MQDITSQGFDGAQRSYGFQEVQRSQRFEGVLKSQGFEGVLTTGVLGMKCLKIFKRAKYIL